MTRLQLRVLEQAIVQLQEALATDDPEKRWAKVVDAIDWLQAVLEQDEVPDDADPESDESPPKPRPLS